MPTNPRGEAFAKFIRNARDRRRMTQDDLAEASGVSRSTITRWERGDTTTPDPDNLIAICRALGVNHLDALAVLGYGTESQPPTGLEPSLQQVIDALRDPAVSDDDKQRWIDYLMYLRSRARSQQRPSNGRKAG